MASEEIYNFVHNIFGFAFFLCVQLINLQHLVDLGFILTPLAVSQDAKNCEMEKKRVYLF